MLILPPRQLYNRSLAVVPSGGEAPLGPRREDTMPREGFVVHSRLEKLLKNPGALKAACIMLKLPKSATDFFQKLHIFPIRPPWLELAVELRFSQR
jgi:hypothetical protein